MKDFKLDLNPFSDENYSALLIAILVMVIMVTILLSDKFIIPRFNPENKFRKWWKKHMINFDPYEKN